MAESRALVAFACACGDKGQGCVLDVTLPSGLLAFACDDCGAGRTLDEHASETQCHVCREIKYFRICPRCEARVFRPGLTEKQQKKVFFIGPALTALQIFDRRAGCSVRLPTLSAVSVKITI